MTRAGCGSRRWGYGDEYSRPIEGGPPHACPSEASKAFLPSHRTVLHAVAKRQHILPHRDVFEPLKDLRMQDFRLFHREVRHKLLISPSYPRLLQSRKDTATQKSQAKGTRNLQARGAKETIIGIDLGTSNSAVAVIEDGTPVIIKVEADRPTLPSVISLGQVRVFSSYFMDLLSTRCIAPRLHIVQTPGI